MKTNKKILIELISGSKNGFMKTFISQKYKSLRDWVVQQTPKLNENFSWKTRIYWVFNGIDDFPKCERCGKDILSDVKNVFEGYVVKTCSKKCRYEAAAEKTRNTCLKKYGVGSVMQTDSFKQKTKETCLKKYGVDHVAKIPGVAEKRKKTCLELYGVEVPAQSEEIRRKIRNTCAKRYGASSFSKTEDFLKKVNETCQQRYGVDFPSQSEHAKAAKRKTYMERYGVDSFSKTKEFIEKSRKTCLERYGVESVWQAGAEGREKSRKTRLERYGSETFNNRAKAAETCQERYGSDTPGGNLDVRRKMTEGYMKASYRTLCGNQHVVPAFSEAEYLTKTPGSVFRWKCMDCGREFDTAISWNFYETFPVKAVARCLNCFPAGFAGASREEKDFIDAVRGIYGGTVLERQRVLRDGDDRRKWKEIDCYLPDINVGLEYDGLYFHQHVPDDDSHRHLAKTVLAEMQGIKLIHVRSDEWLSDRDAVLARIKGVIEGKIEFDVQADIIELDRATYDKCFRVQGYRLLGETTPSVLQVHVAGREYEYEDCGKLIYRKTKR